jgi:hypothetical protein
METFLQDQLTLPTVIGVSVLSSELSKSLQKMPHNGTRANFHVSISLSKLEDDDLISTVSVRYNNTFKSAVLHNPLYPRNARISLTISHLLLDNFHNSRFGEGAEITELITFARDYLAHDATHDL